MVADILYLKNYHVHFKVRFTRSDMLFLSKFDIQQFHDFSRKEMEIISQDFPFLIWQSAIQIVFYNFGGLMP